MLQSLQTACIAHRWLPHKHTARKAHMLALSSCLAAVSWLMSCLGFYFLLFPDASKLSCEAFLCRADVVLAIPIPMFLCCADVVLAIPIPMFLCCADVVLAIPIPMFLCCADVVLAIPIPMFLCCADVVLAIPIPMFLCCADVVLAIPIPMFLCCADVVPAIPIPMFRTTQLSYIISLHTICLSVCHNRIIYMLIAKSCQHSKTPCRTQNATLFVASSGEWHRHSSLNSQMPIAQGLAGCDRLASAVLTGWSQ